MTGCTTCTGYNAPPPVLDVAVLEAAIAPTKPPPQVLGVSGIAETPIVLDQPKLNWAMVAALPPFQMFLAERDGPNQTGKNSQEWATGVAMHLAATTSDTALFDAYAAWHEAKGYWPGETPMGQAKE